MMEAPRVNFTKRAAFSRFVVTLPDGILKALDALSSPSKACVRQFSNNRTNVYWAVYALAPCL